MRLLDTSAVVAMAATSASRLDLPPAFPPYDIPVPYAPGQLYSTKTPPFALPPSCLRPPPPLPLACGGLDPVGCCAYTSGSAPAFPPFPWAPPPPLPATRCSIAEIDESPKADVEGNLSPRSVQNRVEARVIEIERAAKGRRTLSHCTVLSPCSMRLDVHAGLQPRRTLPGRAVYIMQYDPPDEPKEYIQSWRYCAW